MSKLYYVQINGVSCVWLWIMKRKLFFHECISLVYENYKTSQTHTLNDLNYLHKASCKSANTITQMYRCLETATALLCR
jgi:hypothetical protein